MKLLGALIVSLLFLISPSPAHEFLDQPGAL